MSKMFGISIIVCNYNANLSSILLTLASSIRQKDCNFEIIFCDDGSTNNYKNEIIEYFKKHNFSNYQLSCSKTNQGTLKNLYDGILLAKYKYCKTIGCGDLFYDDLSLKRVLDLFESTKADVIFSKCCYFYDYGKEIKTFNVSNPKDLKCYSLKHYNAKTIQKRLIMNQDMILGAGVYASTEYLESLYHQFLGRIKYTEDGLLIYSAAFGAKIFYIDDYCVYYEYGTGISTSTNQAFRQIIEDESNKIFDFIKEDCSDKHILKLIKVRNKIKYSPNALILNLRKIFLTPSQIKIKYLDRHCRKQKPQLEFYRKCKEDSLNAL